MSPPRRRSARLASTSKVCKQTRPLTAASRATAIEPANDVLTFGCFLRQTPKASTHSRLGSVIEGDEEPSQQSTRSLDAIMSSPMPAPKPSTPASAAPVKLAMSEMHPSKVHQTMAPPSSGLKFGFVDINADGKSRDRPSGINQTTPSKTRVPSSSFTFRVASPMGGEMNLGPEARQMMEDLREEAAKHKAQILADREKQRSEEDHEVQDDRRIAKAKGKMGRFSDIHMKEFKKMDSIAARPTGTPAKAPNFTPLKSGVKRSQSKANLDEHGSSVGKTRLAKPLPKVPEKEHEQPEPTNKRARQRIEDDTSTVRPVSRDGSQLPRPKSSGNDSTRSGIPRSQTLTNLSTPTKASVARANLTKTPTITLVKSPSKPDLATSIKSAGRAGLGGLVKSPTRSDISSLLKSPSKSGLGGSLKKSATTFGNLGASRDIPSLVQTPGRFDRVKSILKRQFSASKPKSHLPQIAGAVPKTPSRTEKAISIIPMTTPGQKFAAKHVEFTPDTKQAALSQNSPSPTKSSIPRSKTLPKLPMPNFRPLDAALSANKDQTEVSYPDLSSYGADGEEDTQISGETKESSVLPEGVPGTFSFRSDHTIRFDSTSPNGFGGSAGQISLRHVRPSVGPAARMPGAFPTGNEPSSPNKENNDPAFMTGIAHGMSNKKRHRAVWDDEEIKSGISHGISNKKRHRADSVDDDVDQDEGAQRGAKKLRQTPAPAEGQALLAPRLIATPSPLKKKQAGNSRTPSPQKKGISLSRLNMLARPKNRK
ncbi:hypothetical protein SCUP234_07579 [Seiridium cupressi]